MSFSPVPNYKFDKLTDIKASFLNERGIKLLMLDLDNTIAPYDEQSPSNELSVWAAKVRREGIELYIVSNSTKDDRVSAFSRALGVSYINRAFKPSPRALREVMQKQGISPQDAALAGDQVFTDVLAANLANVTSIAVYPIKFTNPLLAVRYIFELPFRAVRRKEKTGVL